MNIFQKFKLFFKVLKNPVSAKLLLEDIQEKPVKSDPSHIRMLSLLQQSGRLIDFLKEDIQGFTDGQIGAVARKIHSDCNAILEEIVTVRPIRQENEGTTVTIDKGFDPSEIKITGNVKGEAPYTGKLVHKGWKVHKHSLPKQTGSVTPGIIYPAEIEI